MPTREIEARIQALLQSPNVSAEKKRALQAQLDAYKAKQAAVAPPAPAAPEPAPLGGGPGGTSAGGGAEAPGADPYEVSFNAKEAERAAAEPDAPARPAPDLLEQLGGASVSALAGLDSTVTGGVLGALARKYVPEAGDVIDAAREEFPWAGGAGRIAGLTVPGLGRSVGTASAGAAGLKSGQGVLQTLLRGSLAGGGGAAVQSGVEAAVAGEDPLAAAEDAFGAGVAFGGPLALLGMAGRALAAKNRDPLTPAGRDLQLAEKGGATTDTLRGLKPSHAVAELSEEATRLGGVSPERVAGERAAPVLGKELQRRIGSTTSSIKMQNEAGYEAPLGEASLRPMVQAQVKALKEATYEGRRLPGVSVKDTVNWLRESADIKVVPRTSPEAHMADAEDISDLPVGLARHLGLVRGGATAADSENVVLIVPRSVGAKSVDVMQRAFDKRASVGDDTYDPAKVPAKKMAAAAREAREDFGPEWAETKAAQSKALGQMKNALEASGLPRETSAVDLDDVGTRAALEGGVRRYRTDTNAAFDKELDRLALENQALRQALDLSAGTGATQRLLGRADFNATPSGKVSPYGFTGALRLHVDPLARWLSTGSMVPVPAAASAVSEQRRGK